MGKPFFTESGHLRFLPESKWGLEQPLKQAHDSRGVTIGLVNQQRHNFTAISVRVPTYDGGPTLILFRVSRADRATVLNPR